jgi:hypothetical protein
MYEMPDGWKQITFFGYPADPAPHHEGAVRVRMGEEEYITVAPLWNNKKFYRMKNVNGFCCPWCKYLMNYFWAREPHLEKCVAEHLKAVL